MVQNCQQITERQSSDTVPTLIDGNTEASSDKEKTDLLNQYFCSQSSLDDSDHHSLPDIAASNNTHLSCIIIPVQDVS